MRQVSQTTQNMGKGWGSAVGGGVGLFSKQVAQYLPYLEIGQSGSKEHDGRI